MITAGDFRNGVTFEMDGQVMQVVEFQHVKPGKGAAFVRTKMKNVITGAVTETSFNPTAKFESATIDRKTMEYSYNDGNLYYFMDPETYELIPIDESALGSNFRFVKENMEPPTLPSPPPSRPALRSRCRCSSTRATASASTPAWASTSSARRAEKQQDRKKTLPRQRLFCS